MIIGGEEGGFSSDVVSVETYCWLGEVAINGFIRDLLYSLLGVSALIFVVIVVAFVVAMILVLLLVIVVFVMVLMIVMVIMPLVFVVMFPRLVLMMILPFR